MDFCVRTAPMSRTAGKFLYVIKVVVPIIIIILAVMDLVKAITANKDDAIKASATKLLKRMIMGILIFLLPTLVHLAFNILGNTSSKFIDKSHQCESCLLDPFGDDCK